jgi:hypothetical protein
LLPNSPRKRQRARAPPNPSGRNRLRQLPASANFQLNGSVAQKGTVARIDPPGAALALDGEGREIQKSLAMSLRAIRAGGRIGRVRGEKR